MTGPGAFVRQITVVLSSVLMFGGCGQLGNGQIEGSTGGSSGIGSPGSGGAGSSSATGSGGSLGATVASDLPCDVANLLSAKCINCHAKPPKGGAPMALTNYAQMTAKAISDPTKTMAEVAVSRMMDTQSPMPPVGYPQATATEIAAVQSWISAGYPTTGCASVTPPPPTSSDGGTSVPDPFAVAPTCTSGQSWTGGTNGSSSMQPGVACINCHQTTGGEAPTFTIAGTVYPTAHEPDQCNGINGTTDGAQVVITDANGKTFSITPNSVGNFSSSMAVATPFKAKVTYMGRTREMLTPQTLGDCNACHTQNGTAVPSTASPAPGRIILP